MHVKDCPECGLVNPPTAQRCDCGWDFELGRQERSYVAPKPRRPIAVGVGGGVILIIVVIALRVFFALLRAAAN